MSLSRKRRKELNKLRGSAEELWSRQQEVLDKANGIAREASRQVSLLTREEVAPRVRDSYQQYVQPGVDASFAFARDAGHNFENTVGGALGSVMTMGDIAQEARRRSAAVRSGVAKDVKRTVANAKKNAAPAKASGPGFGTYLAITAGVIAAAGVAYAVWQTFRADDELWIADESVPPTENPAV